MLRAAAARVWNSKATYRTTAIVISALGISAASSASRTTRLDYWEHDRRDFDVYIENPTSEDLPILLRKFQEGQEVWPWVWCQPNGNGPHHVFVGTLTDSVLEEIQRLLQNPQNNIMIVTSPTELSRVPGNLVERCGIVADAAVQLVNRKDKILMLNDERVMAFDYLTTTKT